MAVAAITAQTGAKGANGGRGGRCCCLRGMADGKCDRAQPPLAGVAFG